MKKEPTNKPVLIKSFDQLQALVDKPLPCQFALDGELVELPCRRITQETQERVLAILRKAVPPMKKGPNPDYDHRAPSYLAECEHNEKVARAVIVYSGCPAIAAKKPGLVDDEAIYQFVRPLLSETILEIICLTIQKGGLDRVDRANFISPPGSES
jgi:hypothetical protein